jgi:hypothetical protein
MPVIHTALVANKTQWVTPSILHKIIFPMQKYTFFVMKYILAIFIQVAIYNLQYKYKCQSSTFALSTHKSRRTDYMVTKTVAIYVFLDDIFKSMQHKEAINRKTTDSEIVTILLIAAGYFGGNIEKAISFVHSTGLMPTMLNKSRFNRRMRRMREFLSDLFFQVGLINSSCYL